MTLQLDDMPFGADAGEPGLVIATFEVVGTPIPQGSMQAFNRRGGGRPIVTSDNKRTRPWKDAVTWAASEARSTFWGEYAGAVGVEMVFRIVRPKGHTGKRGLLPSAPAEHAVKPDIDKLVRAVLDAIVDAAVIVDDALVAELRVTKRYVTAMEAPGVRVMVRSR